MNTLIANIYGIRPRALISAAVVAGCLFAAGTPAAGADIVVMKDVDIRPYREAIRGFRTTCECTVKELSPSSRDAVERIIKARPDAVFAVGTDTLRRLQGLEDIPVIYTMVMPSESAKLSVGGNVSGVVMEVAPKAYLSAMVRLFPGAKRIGLITDPSKTGPFVERAVAVADSLGVTLVVKTISSEKQVPERLQELKGRVDVFWMLPDSTLVNSNAVEYLMLYSFQNGIPVFSFAKKYLKIGAAAALTIDPFSMGAQAGELARDLLEKGEGPVRAHAENPRLIVNLKIISKLGVRTDKNAVREAEIME